MESIQRLCTIYFSYIQPRITQIGTDENDRQKYFLVVFVTLCEKQSQSGRWNRPYIWNMNVNGVAMKLSFVADGEFRWRFSKEDLARLQVLQEEIQAKYAGQLVEAGFFRRVIIRWQISVEMKRERLKLEPSPYSLY